MELLLVSYKTAQKFAGSIKLWPTLIGEKIRRVANFTGFILQENIYAFFSYFLYYLFLISKYQTKINVT